MGRGNVDKQSRGRKTAGNVAAGKQVSQIGWKTGLRMGISMFITVEMKDNVKNWETG